MTITAKYAGQCSKCGGSIAVGQKINWVRGAKPTHAECGSPAVATSPAGGSRRSSQGQYAPGGRRCPDCGSSECAKAWNSRDLCDED